MTSLKIGSPREAKFTSNTSRNNKKTRNSPVAKLNKLSALEEFRKNVMITYKFISKSLSQLVKFMAVITLCKRWHETDVNCIYAYASVLWRIRGFAFLSLYKLILSTGSLTLKDYMGRFFFLIKKMYFRRYLNSDARKYQENFEREEKVFIVD